MILHRLTPLACLALGLSLSACAQWSADGPVEAPSPPAAAKAEAGTPPPVRQTAARPAPQVKGLRPEPRPGGGQTAGLPVPVPPPGLVGLSEQETADLLGPPAEESATPPGKVWLYRAAGCQLSVHLFPDMDKGGFYTLDYTADGAKDECLGKVAGGARKRGGALAPGQATQG